MPHTLLKQMNSLESKNGKDYSTGIEGCEAIADGDDDDILDTVLLRVVVGTKADDGAKGKTKGVEDLVGSIQPDSWLQKHLHLGREHVNESFSSTLESDATEEEDGENKVGEESCEVDNLARAGNA